MPRYALKSIVEGDASRGERSRYLTIGEMSERAEGPGFNVKLYLIPFAIQALVDDRQPGRFRLTRPKSEQESAENPGSYPDFYLGNMQTTRSGDKYLLHLNMFPALQILASPMDRPEGGAPRTTERPAEQLPLDAAPEATEDPYDDIPF